jgi:hypothetical protein
MTNWPRFIFIIAGTVDIIGLTLMAIIDLSFYFDDQIQLDIAQIIGLYGFQILMFWISSFYFLFAYFSMPPKEG